MQNMRTDEQRDGINFRFFVVVLLRNEVETRERIYARIAITVAVMHFTRTFGVNQHTDVRVMRSHVSHTDAFDVCLAYKCAMGCSHPRPDLINVACVSATVSTHIINKMSLGTGWRGDDDDNSKQRKKYEEKCRMQTVVKWKNKTKRKNILFFTSRHQQHSTSLSSLPWNCLCAFYVLIRNMPNFCFVFCCAAAVSRSMVELTLNCFRSFLKLRRDLITLEQRKWSHNDQLSITSRSYNSGCDARCETPNQRGRYIYVVRISTSSHFAS